MKVRESLGLIRPWLSFVIRLAAGIIMILAGTLKMLDLDTAVYAVRSYEILPPALVTPTGYILPFVEVAIGFFLVLGLLTRWVAVAYVSLLAVFVFGMVWVQARGLEIGCGCFGGGGPVLQADYLGHLRDQVLFISLGAWLIVFPRSALSVDRWLDPTK